MDGYGLRSQMIHLWSWICSQPGKRLFWITQKPIGFTGRGSFIDNTGLRASEFAIHIRLELLQTPWGYNLRRQLWPKTCSPGWSLSQLLFFIVAGFTCSLHFFWLFTVMDMLYTIWSFHCLLLFWLLVPVACCLAWLTSLFLLPVISAFIIGWWYQQSSRLLQPHTSRLIPVRMNMDSHSWFFSRFYSKKPPMTAA